MSGYERYQAVINGKECDYLPRVPILMAFAARYIGSTYGEFASDYKVLTEANRRCAADFGYDQVSAISDPYRETAGFGAKIKFVPDGVPRLLTEPLAHTKDLRTLKTPDPHTAERMRDRIFAVQELKALFHQQYSILGWVEGPAAEAANLRGVTNFLFDLMDDRDFCHKLMERCTDVGIAFAQTQIEAGADTIGIGDAIVSQISPSLYKQLIFPYQKRLVEEIKGAGALVRLHICGDISKHLPALEDLDVDILDLDWPVDLTYARSVMGNTVLVSNPNPVADIQQGTPGQIKKQIEAMYTAAGNPFLIGAGCEIPPSTPQENLRALCTPVMYRRDNE